MSREIVEKNKLSLADAIRLAHTVDIKVRVEGKDCWYEGDFLKQVCNLQDWAGIERLLAQEREKVRESELVGILLCHRFDKTHTRCRCCKRITELEKARAEGKG